jgi:hypothetical protein
MFLVLTLAISYPIQVRIHLEEFNRRYNLLHVGISFTDHTKMLRYDFRKSNEDNYLTCSRVYCYISDIDETYIPQSYDILSSTFVPVKSLATREIVWGYTNKSFKEITEFEKTLHKKYRLGFYDCRHYVRRFTKWCLDRPTPVWRLHKLWN